MLVVVRQPYSASCTAHHVKSGSGSTTNMTRLFQRSQIAAYVGFIRQTRSRPPTPNPYLVKFPIFVGGRLTSLIAFERVDLICQ